MKTTLIISALFLLIFPAIRGQEDSSGQRNFYQVWVIPQKGFQGKNGVLFKVQDSSVMISNSLRTIDYQQGKYSVSSYSVTGIRDLRIRKKGRGFALLVGGTTGLATGIAISAVYMDYLERTMNPFGFVFGGFLLGVLPALVSTGIGLTTGAVLAKKTNIPIDGSQVNFERHRADLNKRALVNNPLVAPPGISSFHTPDGKVRDADGHTYSLVSLGGQVWLKEDLKTTRYPDGTEIPGIKASGDVVLYTWNSLAGKGSPCPGGFHVPSLEEWTSFVNSLGGGPNAATGMEQGFSEAGKAGQWWSSTESDSASAQSLYVNSSTAGVLFAVVPKKAALAVRCLRDH